MTDQERPVEERNELPEDLRAAVAYDNAARLLGL